jgi:PPK2 family polyphosphate:nucleotide phosphotransferase
MTRVYTTSRPDYRTVIEVCFAVTQLSHGREVMCRVARFNPIESPYLVPFDGSFKIHKALTEPPHGGPSKQDNIDALAKTVAKLAKVQGKFYADDRFSMLLVFQAMDAAGKDGTIRAVMSGVNPQGCQVYAFKPPSHEELDHDFLWRIQRDLPERGRIGIFNRSHYEEVLAVRVNPGYLVGQKLPYVPKDLDELWQERFESIADAEKHWARNGCVILKFFLNVSKKEQHKRFYDRIVDPDDNWKFNSGDWTESEKWDQYMDAYQDAMRATSKPWAPWYVIPADSKSYMRRVVSEIVTDTISSLPLQYPTASAKDHEVMDKVRHEIEAERR